MANEPATIWTGQNGEYSATGIKTLADASANLLADASGNNLVDSGSTFTQMPATIWSSNDASA